MNLRPDGTISADGIGRRATPAEELFALLEPPAWHASAACRGKPTSWFYPDRGEATDQAKALCESCPVRAACTAHAMRVPERFGIWGGTSERQRKRMRRSAA